MLTNKLLSKMYLIEKVSKLHFVYSYTWEVIDPLNEIYFTNR